MQPDPYYQISHHYDRLIGERDEVPFLLKTVQNAAPGARTLLELACGTGQILEHFASAFEVFGLDHSAPMLEKARARIHPATFYCESMTNFCVDRKFDVILCIFNSLNHLLKFSEWKSTFASVAKHLEPGAAFIFDMNTEYGLSTYPAEAPVIIEDEQSYMSIQYYHSGTGKIDMDVTIFESLLDGTYNKLETTITERAFPRSRVEEALEKHFYISSVQDPENSHPNRWSNELVFICHRK